MGAGFDIFGLAFYTLYERQYTLAEKTYINNALKSGIKCSIQFIEQNCVRTDYIIRKSPGFWYFVLHIMKIMENYN